MHVRGTATFVVAALLAGCVEMRPHPAPNLPSSARLVEVRRAGDDATDAPEVQLVAHRPKNALVLSGGGMNGAYTAGVLKGWTASGERPTFDVVTGISTGALIAPFALLGPEFDDALERSYTTLRDNDIFRRRLLVTLPWAESLADSSPLKLRIESEVTPELLERLAEAHRQGRRLYVGTSDLDAKKLVIWDVGAIAAGDDPGKLELVRKVILASASVPGLLPPVSIDVEIDGKPFTELHVDGGVSANLFLRPAMLGRRPQPGEITDSDATVWVVVAGKLRPEREVVSRSLLRIGGESIEGVVQSAFESDLIRIYLLSRNWGARFALAAVPQDFPARLDSLKFNPAVMRQLFDEGYRFGSSRQSWAKAPPGLTPADQAARGGVRFESREGTSVVAPKY
jgi:predicted acylesterase/phospholipase RssA